MADTPSRTSPIVVIAAVSVIIFSAVGVGVMTGFIPSSSSKTAEAPVQAETPRAVPVEPSKAATPAARETPKAAASAPKKPATDSTRVASAEPARSPEPARAAQGCANCGSVISVNAIKQQGEGSGLGAIGGAVVGGVLGHQVGSGRGRDVATVVGAGAGAYAGHQIEKNVKSSQSYSVAVRMDDGSTQNFSYPAEPAFRAGDKVKVVDGRLLAN